MSSEKNNRKLRTDTGKKPGTFEKGNPGKPKGAESKTTKAAKELFLSIMEGEVEFIQEALGKVRKVDPARYLDTLSRLFPYFMPKQVDVTTDGDKINGTPPPIINVHAGGPPLSGSESEVDTKKA